MRKKIFFGISNSKIKRNFACKFVANILYNFTNGGQNFVIPFNRNFWNTHFPYGKVAVFNPNTVTPKFFALTYAS